MYRDNIYFCFWPVGLHQTRHLMLFPSTFLKIAASRCYFANRELGIFHTFPFFSASRISWLAVTSMGFLIRVIYGPCHTLVNDKRRYRLSYNVLLTFVTTAVASKSSGWDFWTMISCPLHSFSPQSCLWS